jgi:NAD+ diphosphatase
MLGFVARAVDTELHIDHDEIEEARWFSRDELRSGAGPSALPPAVSIARHIIDRWVDGELG